MNSIRLLGMHFLEQCWWITPNSYFWRCCDFGLGRRADWSALFWFWKNQIPNIPKHLEAITPARLRNFRIRLPIAIFWGPLQCPSALSLLRQALWGRSCSNWDRGLYILKFVNNPKCHLLAILKECSFLANSRWTRWTWQCPFALGRVSSWKLFRLGAFRDHAIRIGVSHLWIDSFPLVFCFALLQTGRLLAPLLGCFRSIRIQPDGILVLLGFFYHYAFCRSWP